MLGFLVLVALLLSRASARGAAAWTRLLEQMMRGEGCSNSKLPPSLTALGPSCGCLMVSAFRATAAACGWWLVVGLLYGHRSRREATASPS